MNEMKIEREHFLQNQKKLCTLISNEYIRKNSTNVECPATFDGILCWPRTIGPRTIDLDCPPSFIIGYDYPKNARATKICLENGDWYKNRENVTWSNYTTCSPPDGQYATAVQNIESHLGNGTTSSSDLFSKWIPIIIKVRQIGYATSFISLVIAMVVFSMLRKLRNPRNRLHMHLFASFIMRAFMALLKDWLFVDGMGLAWDVVAVDGKSAYIKEHNNWVCKAITSLWQYFIVANYAWILVEGLYLHNLVFLALCADTSGITVYALLGWVSPILVVAVWIIIRVIMEDTLCWTTHDNPSFFLIIRIPIMISILFNFVLFVNIVRVLLLKMKSSVQLKQHKKMQYGRWARSTLVLVPLFGAHYTLFLGLSYHKDPLVELVGLFCDQFFASFQGCFVAFLYCLLNGEVRTEMRRAWAAQKSQRNLDSLPHRKFARSSEIELRKLQRDYGENVNVPTDLFIP